MLIRDLNDDEESLLAIRDILDLDRINPSRIYFNAPIRPPSEPWVKVPSQESIERALDMFPGSIDMTEQEEGEFSTPQDSGIKALLDIAKNHPLREDQALSILSSFIEGDEAVDLLKKLVVDNRLMTTEYDGKRFYRAT